MCVCVCLDVCVCVCMMYVCVCVCVCLLIVICLVVIFVPLFLVPQNVTKINLYLISIAMTIFPICLILRTVILGY